MSGQNSFGQQVLKVLKSLKVSKLSVQLVQLLPLVADWSDISILAFWTPVVHLRLKMGHRCLYVSESVIMSQLLLAAPPPPLQPILL